MGSVDTSVLAGNNDILAPASVHVLDNVAASDLLGHARHHVLRQLDQVVVVGVGLQARRAKKDLKAG